LAGGRDGGTHGSDGGAVTAPLAELLGHVLEGEPAPADEVDAVFRRADRLRRRRTRLLLIAGAAIAATIVLAGYLLTTTLLPVRGVPKARPPRAASAPSVVPVPSAIADPVLALIAPVIDGDQLRIVPSSPARGFGWRQYSVLTAGGQPRGTVQVATYARPGDLCFPRHDGKDGCARAGKASGGVDYPALRRRHRPGLAGQRGDRAAGVGRPYGRGDGHRRA
jgi:hypothetical protein